MVENKEKLFYTMGEVSEMFDVNQSLIRFWEQKFDVLKPKKNKKGNRLFTPADIKNLEIIYHLVKERGMTLEGARRSLKENMKEVERDTEIMRRLQEVRSILVEIKDELKDAEDVQAALPVVVASAEMDVAPVIVPTPEPKQIVVDQPLLF